MSSFLVLFLIIIAIQMAFVLLLGISLLSHQAKANSGDHLSVSVIIAARNERKNLSALIDKLIQQTHSNFEVIVANDRSTDGSHELLEELQSKYPFLKALQIEKLPPEWTGKKYALFSSVQMAKNEVLLFIDADCLPSSDRWKQKWYPCLR